MSPQEFYEKFFTRHPDEKFDQMFRNEAGCLYNERNGIYRYETLPNGDIKFFFAYEMEYHNQPLIENGKMTGHIRMAEPHTMVKANGTFLCKGIGKFTVKRPSEAWRLRFRSIRMKRSFWSNDIIFRIENKWMNLEIKCASMMADSFSSEVIYNKTRYN